MTSNIRKRWHLCTQISCYFLATVTLSLYHWLFFIYRFAFAAEIDVFFYLNILFLFYDYRLYIETLAPLLGDTPDSWLLLSSHIKILLGTFELILISCKACSNCQKKSLTGSPSCCDVTSLFFHISDSHFQQRSPSSFQTSSTYLKR